MCEIRDPDGGYAIEKLEEIKSRLGVSNQSLSQQYNMKAKEILFDVLYEWRKVNPAANIPQLAQELIFCNLPTLAAKLCPK